MTAYELFPLLLVAGIGLSLFVYGCVASVPTALALGLVIVALSVLVPIFANWSKR